MDYQDLSDYRKSDLKEISVVSFAKYSVKYSIKSALYGRTITPENKRDIDIMYRIGSTSQIGPIKSLFRLQTDFILL
jgi:hypothetical protein